VVSGIQLDRKNNCLSQKGLLDNLRIYFLCFLDLFTINFLDEWIWVGKTVWKGSVCLVVFETWWCLLANFLHQTTI